MFPDAKWLDALKLPTKTKVAVALACGALLYLFKVRAISFGGWDPIVVAGLLIAVVVFGVLVLVDGLAWLAQPLSEKRRVSLLAARRGIVRKEKEEQREGQRAAILAALDHLSRREMRYVADALESNSPTFYTYVHSPPVAMLLGKRLVWTPGSPHHEDHYPFTFADFVWDELLRRREEFLDKERAFKDAEEAERRAGR